MNTKMNDSPLARLAHEQYEQRLPQMLEALDKALCECMLEEHPTQKQYAKIGEVIYRATKEYGLTPDFICPLYAMYEYIKRLENE